MLVVKFSILFFCFISCTRGQDTYTYDGYDDDDYIYDEEYYEDEEGDTLDAEGNPKYDDYYSDYQDEKVLTPMFVSEESVVLVDKGNTARLHCRLENLGSLLISWRKLNDDGTSTFVSVGDNAVPDSTVMVSSTDSSSTLTLPFIEEKDTGVYICEVSSDPVMTQKHRVEIRSAARVEIEDFPESGEITLRHGEALDLNCQGFGDPEPDVFWTRKNSLLPDGSSKTDIHRLQFSPVSGRHSGTYVCNGDNGFGQPSHKEIRVLVKYAPEIVVNDEFMEDGSLQLICVVKGYPAVTASWSRSRSELDSSVEYSEENGKHILRFRKPTKEAIGVYNCSASNTEGDVHATLDIQDDVRLMPTQAPSVAPPSPPSTQGTKTTLKPVNVHNTKAALTELIDEGEKLTEAVEPYIDTLEENVEDELDTVVDNVIPSPADIPTLSLSVYIFLTCAQLVARF